MIHTRNNPPLFWGARKTFFSAVQKVTYPLFLIIVTAVMISCTLYRPPDAVVRDKSRAIDLFLYARHTDSPEYYERALSYATIPAAYYELGEHALRQGQWRVAQDYYEMALYHAGHYGMAASRLEYLTYLEKEGRLETVSVRPEKDEIEEDPFIVEDVPGEEKIDPSPEETKEAEPSETDRIVTTSPFSFREEPAVPTGLVVNPLREVEFHLDKARLLYQHRLYEEAKEELKIIIEGLEYKETPDPYFILLDIHKAERNEGKARNVIELMTSLFPEEDEVFFESSLFFIDRGNFEKAVEYQLQAIELHPSDPRYYNNLGVCYRNLGEKKQAEHAYKKALEQDAEFVDAYLNLGILYETVFYDEERAREQYEKYLELDGPRSNDVEKWLEEM